MCKLQTHIDRISEDVEGFARIIDVAVPFEINADISHYVYRGIKKGPALQKILERVGHTHQRMAREHGDLSADVPDPEKDWASKGLTWQAFEAMRPCFKGGLSSRCVVGESGPMHLVEDAILLDAKLVPLYRLMALTCDAEVGGAAAPSAPSSAGTSTESPGSLDISSIAEAERILAQHFASTAPAPASSSASIPGGDMSTLEAERILAKHFGK